MNQLHAQKPNQIGQTKICPECGNKYSGHPAISRKDNKTEVCPKCGVKEALEIFISERKTPKDDLLEFCQYILDRWELDTKDIQEKAQKLIKKYGKEDLKWPEND